MTFRTSNKMFFLQFVERVYYSEILYLILIVFSNNHSVSATCPDLCQCVSVLNSLKITCANRNFTAIPAAINETVSVKVVHTLDLSNNSIEKISFRHYHLKELRILDISKNVLRTIHNLKTLINLQDLNLSDNKIENLDAIRELPKLKILNLSRNPFFSLDTLTNDALTHLVANECEISYLNPNSLLHLPNLTRLSLHYNPLKLIKSPSNMNLRSLDLSHCDVIYLERDSFQNLPNLIHLSLKNNSQLGTYAYEPVSIIHDKLQALDISFCNIKFFAFNKLPQLKLANLANNKLTEINKETFFECVNLQLLLMNNNGIKYVDQNAFHNLEKLRQLDLSHNQISHIDANMFFNLYYLQVLNLSHNGVQDVSGLTIPYLYSLDLSHNEIKRFGTIRPVKLAEIRYLNLSNNNLEHFPHLSNAFNLESLDLRNNKISTINPYSLMDLHGLRQLILSENELQEPLDIAIFMNNLNLTYLDLSRNPWHCNCHKLKSLYAYLSNLDNSSVDKAICFTPIEKEGYSWQSACIIEWIAEPSFPTPASKTRNFIILILLILFVLSGSIISVRHTIKVRRIERNRQIDAERTEIRERLRRLQRRNQQLEEEAINHLSEPRINPLELVGPPSYEEAVDMARLTRSLDTLNSLGGENTPVTQALGSVDNLRSKRRARRPRKKKTPSDDSLTKRETRREIRLKRDRELRQNPCSVIDVERANQSRPNENRVRYSVAFNVSHSSSEQIDSSSDTNRHRPPTPIAKKRKRLRIPTLNATTTDDEASDGDVADKRHSTGVTIINLHSESRGTCND